MTILSAAVDLLAVIAPMTGTRAAGTIRMVGSDTPVPRNTLLIPVIKGQARPSLLFKVAEGPNDDGSWTADPGGTDISAFSNIGGSRHNVPDGTEFRIYPPTIPEITSAVANGDFTGGSDPSAWGSLKDAVIYGEVEGPEFHIDLQRSELKAFPGVLVAWTNSDPADGGTIETRRRTSKATTTFREQLMLTIFTNRSESEGLRRGEGTYILDEVSRWIAHRQAVDGRVFSAPNGAYIQRRSRERGRHEAYKKFDVYSLLVTVQQTIERHDNRFWDDWNTSVIDVLKPQDPPLPDQGDVLLIDDMTVEMEQD